MYRGESWRIRLTYWWRHRRWPALAQPRLFTELVQLRKLNDRDPRLPSLADKVAVKAFVAETLGDAWIIPTLWHGRILPEEAPWRRPFVVKSRHGCNQTIFVRSEAAGDDWPLIRRRANRWTTRRYGYWLDEWLYRHIPRGLLVEPFVGDGPDAPIDYKFYVFGSRVEYVQVHLGRGACHRWVVFDRDWRRVSSDSDEPDPVPPVTLDTMIAAAEALGNGFDFVRIDLYEVAGRPLFGEMTFYPGSGLDRFDPVSLDLAMGARWLGAAQSSTAGAVIPAPCMNTPF